MPVPGSGWKRQASQAVELVLLVDSHSVVGSFGFVFIEEKTSWHFITLPSPLVSALSLSLSSLALLLLLRRASDGADQKLEFHDGPIVPFASR